MQESVTVSPMNIMQNLLWGGKKMNFENKVCKLINLGWSDQDAREFLESQEEDEKEEEYEV